MNWNQFYNPYNSVSFYGSQYGYPSVAPYGGSFQYPLGIPYGGSFIEEYKIRNRLHYPIWINRFRVPPRTSIVVPAAYLGNGINIFGLRGAVSNAYFPLVGGSIGCGTAMGKQGSRSKTCDHAQARIRVKYTQHYNHPDEIKISRL